MGVENTMAFLFLSPRGKKVEDRGNESIPFSSSQAEEVLKRTFEKIKSCFQNELTSCLEICAYLLSGKLCRQELG